MRKKIIFTTLLPVIALVFIFGFTETVLGQRFDYDTFLESLTANGFEFEEAGFYQNGSKIVYVGGEQLLVHGHGITRSDDSIPTPPIVSITWMPEYVWANANMVLWVVYGGKDAEIISFLNNTFNPSEYTAINVTIDGVPVIFPDQASVIVDGRTLVPVRGVFEELGWDVNWSAETSTARLQKNSFDVRITIGEDAFQWFHPYRTANHMALVCLDVPAQIINGRTMLPIRAVLEAVGYSVEWDAATQTVSITR